MSSKKSPQLSIIMITEDRYETCRRTISYLSKQTIVAEIELIISAPSRAEMALDEEELACFHSFQIVEVGKLRSTGHGFAAGVRAAKAPIVIYGEEHSYPDPRWAEILVEKHELEGVGAVGCVMGNANPERLASWAHLYGQFGPVVGPAKSGFVAALGGHHAAYKRELLLTYGELLPEMLNNECALYVDLRRRGYKLYLAGDAISYHVNVAKPWTYFRLDFMGQRGFAAARAHSGEWSILRRALYIAACPLIPFVRLRRVVRAIYASGRQKQLMPQVLFIIVPAMICGAVGEAIGYLSGNAGSVAEERIPIELNRYAYTD